jgi:hypothetical protein
VPRPTQGFLSVLRLRGCHPLWPTFPGCSASLTKTTGLIRFRSPLLAESPLMSVPPGTEMFQFPGFASRPYEFRPGYPRKGGFPHSEIRGSTIARISPRLIAACHVLHRLLAPRHPPNALVSLEIHQHRPHAGPNRALPAEMPRHPNHKHKITPLYFQPIPSSLVKEHPPTRQPRGAPRQAAVLEARKQWRQPESNRRPPACKAGALPAELCPRSKARRPTLQPNAAPRKALGQGGLEPPTPRLSSVCSNQLSYWPKIRTPASTKGPAGPTAPARAKQ